MTAAIETRALTVRLGDFTVLDSIDLEIAAGEFVAILGPNGGGKSTLLKVLLGLIEPSGGQALVAGRRARPAAGIGYVPQLKTLDRSFPALSCEVVLSGMLRRWPWRLGGPRHAQVHATLAQVGAAQLMERPFAYLSGGELQRVYLARAIARQPELLLLDEPAAGIDLAGEADMFAVLEQYRRARPATVLMVTHDWGAAYHHASSVLLLRHRVIACGPPAEVLTDDNLRECFGHSGHAHVMGWKHDDVRA